MSATFQVRLYGLIAFLLGILIGGLAGYVIRGQKEESE